MKMESDAILEEAWLTMKVLRVCYHASNEDVEFLYGKQLLCLVSKGTMC